VQPDRLGFAPGARWSVTGDLFVKDIRSAIFVWLMFRPAQPTGTLQVLETRAPERWRFQFVDDRLDVDVLLEYLERDLTRVHLSIEGAWFRVRDSLPRLALQRLQALVQTAASL
jgi:hypothetical protein